MSLIKTIKNQLGLSVTPANNFTLTAEADNGTMKLARGNAGATTQDLVMIASDGRVSFPATEKVSGSMGRLADNSMTAGVWDDVSFNDINWQVGTSLVAGSTFGLVAPRTGPYHVSAGLYITGTSLTYCAIELFANGSTSKGFSGGTTTTAIGYVHISNTIWLTAGDVLTVKGYAAAGSSIVCKGPSNGTFFSVFEL